MKSVNCFSIITATAVIALSCIAGTINAAASQDLLLPFNDLLPPLLDTTEIKVSTTVKPVTTTTPPITTTTRAVTKTTIKRQQPKELNKDAKVSSIDLKQEQHLHLIPFNDLLPPLLNAEATGTETLLTAKTTATPTTTRRTTAAPTRRSSITTKASLPVSETKPTKKSAYKSYTQQGIQQYNAKQQKLKQHVYKQNNVASQPLRQESLEHYINYFQQTTHRPPRGELPTITPFPRVLKRRQT
ncbi:uncharacterized protein LOC119684116 [Teleopsis dalmanni]|uniref:uncharacterized protein LOC119684116 n=1 Tax=Teleopsis dalmanni TaxID=139649 RepID=UPI0018CF565F|nr:uncharacterized protein LOC119684116 [Teleopsis dalmanni]